MNILRNQQQKTMHTSSEHNLLALDQLTILIKKDVFLSNTRNKQNTVNLFSKILLKERFKTVHAPGDANTLIGTHSLIL